MLKGSFARSAATSLISSWCGLLYRQASSISVLSPGFKRLLIERGVPGEKVHVIYNWTDEDIFRPSPRDTELAESFGVRDTFNLVYAGNLGAFQGLDVAIRAAALLRDIPEFRLLIVGTGQKEAELKDLAARLSCSNVVFIPRREYWEMPRIYSISDALLIHLKDFPFFATTIPSKTQVSMACGRPIVVAVKGDTAELVQRANAGLACEPDNPQALADCVRRLARMSAAQREQMGIAGREFYFNQMSLSEGAQRTRDLLYSAVSGLDRKKAYA
jgi:glycosyltransferase involved in cell wall biosynthesis